MPTTATDNPILRAALEYAGLGWQVVPLYGIDASGWCQCSKGDQCQSAGKHPRVNSWQNEATTDEEKIDGWFERWPGSNVGVQFGEQSNLIDVECDDAEQEKNLAEMFGGEFPATPTFKSGRGKHRLFRWRGDLPAADSKGIVYINKVGFRIGGNKLGAQSVFPPSMHKSGMTYVWLIHPAEADVAEIPDAVLARIWNADGGLFGDVTTNGKPRPPRAGKKLYDQRQVVESVDGRDNALTSEAAALWREKFRAYGPAAFEAPERQTEVYEILWALNRAKCIPPMDDADVHKKCETARQFIQRVAAKERTERGAVNLTAHGLELKEGEWWPGNWRLTVVHSDPAIYRLTVPAWKELIGSEGAVVLESKEYADAGAVARKILLATRTVVVDDVPDRWPAIWNGQRGNKKEGRLPTRGLKAKLLDGADREEALPEEQRFRVVADMLSEKIDEAKEAESPDHRGYPVKMPDGSIWIRWSRCWREDLQFGRVTTPELADLRKRLGVRSQDSKRENNNRGASHFRYIVLQENHLENLRQLDTG